VKRTGSAGEAAVRAARWAGYRLNEAGLGQLGRYAEWLVDEAQPAGLLGPGEAGRVWERHIADALVFAAGWPQAPSHVVDLGSGAGLPGIPLALLWPQTQIVLVERSERRADQLKRAIRILNLERVVVKKASVESLESGWEALVMRAVFRPERAVSEAGRLLGSGGRAVAGWRRTPFSGAEAADLSGLSDRWGLACEVRVVPAEVLDVSASLLIMTRRE
jgi:16S rRNA (guanine527-N7)-methyltransferase